MSGSRSGAIAALIACGGCTALAGLDDLAFEPTNASGGTTTVGAGAAGAAVASVGPGGAGAAAEGGSGASTTGGGAGGAGGAPSAGGAGPDCGDGDVGGSEECDDANVIVEDGCTGCIVDCDEPNATKHPTTHHCYWWVDAGAGWTSARAQCGVGVDEWADLVAFESEAEHTYVSGLPGLPSSDYWTGGTDQTDEGVYVWTNGEPWVPNLLGTTSSEATQDCLFLDNSQAYKLSDEECNNTQDFICERRAADAP